MAEVRGDGEFLRITGVAGAQETRVAVADVDLGESLARNDWEPRGVIFRSGYMLEAVRVEISEPWATLWIRDRDFVRLPTRTLDVPRCLMLWMGGADAGGRVGTSQLVRSHGLEEAGPGADSVAPMAGGPDPSVSTAPESKMRWVAGAGGTGESHTETGSADQTGGSIAGEARKATHPVISAGGSGLGGIGNATDAGAPAGSGGQGRDRPDDRSAIGPGQTGWSRTVLEVSLTAPSTFNSVEIHVGYPMGAEVEAVDFLGPPGMLREWSDRGNLIRFGAISATPVDAPPGPLLRVRFDARSAASREGFRLAHFVLADEEGRPLKGPSGTWHARHEE
jgi:hypothetical protein